GRSPRICCAARRASVPLWPAWACGAPRRETLWLLRAGETRRSPPVLSWPKTRGSTVVVRPGRARDTLLPRPPAPEETRRRPLAQVWAKARELSARPPAASALAPAECWPKARGVSGAPPETA